MGDHRTVETGIRHFVADPRAVCARAKRRTSVASDQATARPTLLFSCQDASEESERRESDEPNSIEP